jgi:hypothetical protein
LDIPGEFAAVCIGQDVEVICRYPFYDAPYEWSATENIAVSEMVEVALSAESPKRLTMPSLRRRFSLRVSGQSSSTSIEVLLPNGVFLKLLVKMTSTLKFLKKRIWAEAAQYPLFHLLEDER